MNAALPPQHVVNASGSKCLQFCQQLLPQSPQLAVPLALLLPSLLRAYTSRLRACKAHHMTLLLGTQRKIGHSVEHCAPGCGEHEGAELDDKGGEPPHAVGLQEVAHKQIRHPTARVQKRLTCE